MSTTSLVQKLVLAYRLSARDHPLLNLLLEDGEFESNPESIHLAALRVIDEFNRIFPVIKTTYTLETFPSLDLLLYGITVKLSEGILSLSVRNDIRTSPDVQNVSGKIQMLSYYRQIYMDQLRETKRNIDHQALYGGSGASAVIYALDAFVETMTGASSYVQSYGTND